MLVVIQISKARVTANRNFTFALFQVKVFESPGRFQGYIGGVVRIQAVNAAATVATGQAGAVQRVEHGVSYVVVHFTPYQSRES